MVCPFGNSPAALLPFRVFWPIAATTLSLSLSLSLRRWFRWRRRRSPPPLRSSLLCFHSVDLTWLAAFWLQGSPTIPNPRRIGVSRFAPLLEIQVRKKSYHNNLLFPYTINYYAFPSNNFVFFFSRFEWMVSAVTLLDYGAGNVRSLRNAIKYLGFDIKEVNFFFFCLSPI